MGRTRPGATGASGHDRRSRDHAQRSSAPEVWSAAPTPLTDDMRVDLPSVRRMVKHHLRLGVSGLFLCGTNGEGPFLPDDQKRTLIRATVEQVKRRMPIAVQVSDNSAARILKNAEAAAAAGADMAIIAPPYFMVNASPRNILDLYAEAIEKSPLPVGIYDRGAFGAVRVPESVLAEIYARPKVVLAKDSSGDKRRMAIALGVKKRRPGLRLLNGSEFNCVEYLVAGYDGLLLGGGVFNGFLAKRICEAVASGNIALAQRLQARMNRIMYAVYGGKKISCWLAGEKKLLVDLGIFKTWRNFPGYALTASCKNAIRRVIARDSDILIP